MGVKTMISLHKTWLKLSILIMDNNNLIGPYAPNSRRLAGCGKPGLLRSDQQLPKEHYTSSQLGNNTLG